jgi:hypothetical protein
MASLDEKQKELTDYKTNIVRPANVSGLEANRE